MTTPDFDYYLATDWMQAALCRGSDVNFFPTKHESPEAAKAVCSSCPVCEPCYEYAVADAGLHGIWGGSTLKAREQERVRRRRG